MKKILMLIHTFPPIGSVGGSIRIVKFLKYINELRPDFYSTIITLRDDLTLLNDFKLAHASFSEIPSNNIKIIRTNTFQPRHPNHKVYKNAGGTGINSKVSSSKGIKSKFKNIYKFLERNILIPDYSILWFPFSIKAAYKEIKKENSDIIYATAPPFSVLLQAALLKKISKKNLVLDIKDDWIHMTRFYENPNKIQRKVERMMEKFCVKSADKVILVTESSINDFIKRYPEHKEKFLLITNGCDISEYEKYWQIEHPKNRKFTIIHSGVMTSTRNPSGFFEALLRLKNDKIINFENFEMKFIGHIPKNISDMVISKNLEDLIKICDPLEREEYISTISGADLLVAFNYQIKTLIPGKLYDYWGSRKPILLIDLPDSTAAKFVEKNKIGSVKEFEDSAGIKEIIYKYFELWSTCSLVPLNDIKNLFQYDRKNLTKKLIDVFDNL